MRVLKGFEGFEDEYVGTESFEGFEVLKVLNMRDVRGDDGLSCSKPSKPQNLVMPTNFSPTRFIFIVILSVCRKKPYYY